MLEDLQAKKLGAPAFLPHFGTYFMTDFGAMYCYVN